MRAGLDVGWPRPGVRHPPRPPPRPSTLADDSQCAARGGQEREIVLVSVPGPHAFTEAVDAVNAGADVMIFSDNVPVEQEVAAAKEAAEHTGARWSWGPDCGTAIVDGFGLGFANAVRAGPVGIVAASGHRRRSRSPRCSTWPASAGQRGAGRRWTRPVRPGRLPAPPAWRCGRLAADVGTEHVVSCPSRPTRPSRPRSAHSICEAGHVRAARAGARRI